MNTRPEYGASETEINYVRVLSRPSTVDAYINWKELSGIESLLIKLYIDEATRILDLGCGTGRIPTAIKVNPNSYLGIDCSSEMIKAAKNLNPDLNFLCDDILNPSIKVENFDVVLLMNNVIDMLHPYERREAAFKLIKGYLAPKGILIFSSHLLINSNKAGYYQENYHGANVHPYRSTFSQLCEEVENHGFEIKVAARDYRSQIADWAYISAHLR